MRKPALAAVFFGLAMSAPASLDELSIFASAAASSDNGPWPMGGSNLGTRGIHRVQGAYAPRAGDVVLVLAGEYSLASDLFGDGAENERYAQRISAVWSPIQNLELVLRQSALSNHNDASDPATTQYLGDPTFGAKYSVPLNPQIGVGIGFIITLPTSSKGTGLDPEALVLHGWGAFSYLPTPWLSVSLNAGYRYDRSNLIFTRELLPAQRFAAGVNGLQDEQVDQVVCGLGIDTMQPLGEHVAFGPFAELSGGIPIGAELDNAPLRATLGAKLYPFGPESVEVAIGGDFAILGTPKPDGKMAGVPPWEGFARVVAHLGPGRTGAVDSSGSGLQSCNADADCVGTEMVCTAERICAKQVVKVVIEEVEKPTFTIEGGVFDKASGEPIGAATVRLSGFEGTSLAVDYESGGFRSWPIPVGSGIIKVTAAAPSCTVAEQTMQKGKAEEKISVSLALQCGELTGQIKGSLKDARTGRPVKNGQIFVPILNQKIKTNKDGEFSAMVKAGRYQVLISAKRFITQKKEIEIRAGDTVILNVDMNRR